ncbi:unnamed protein product [Medioppia subpectinata]|uniref:Uncharacterized protein n=1 Tax=Medioppia subpectinata TaxID=1979941 RepID=A0A7R9KJN9_9ACAR|nr:unnamed protein product [Medioppia subpectinata]CAG2104922.1 unnamed protein product [Medioppia subpectinata]
MIYQLEKVKQNTLKECDISKLTGLWYAVYSKTPAPQPICMELNKVSEHSLQFKHIINGVVDHTYDLVQNYDTLQGKLDRVIDRGDYQLGYPWWVLHTDYDQFLVVYQCLIHSDDPNDPNASEDVWTIYSRSKTITGDQLTIGREVLLKSGAKPTADDQQEILFKMYTLIVIPLHTGQQSVYPYHKPASKALRELDLKSLEGEWYGVYHRNAKEVNGSCPRLEIFVGNGYVNVTESRGNNTVFVQKMEQNQYLKGKISQVIQLPEGYSVERPWFIQQVDPVLVIYQVTTGSSDTDNWSVYSRNQTLSTTIVESGAQRLVEAGAVRDINGNVGYHCSD